MKIFKKITLFVLTLSMIVGLIVFTPTKSNAAMKLISNKKITVTVGDLDVIVVKNAKTYKKVKYVSSNKKIATVNKKGFVTGKNPGICTITIKADSKKAKSKVTVLPKEVEISTATLVSETSAKVTWVPTRGVSGYYIYYSTNPNKNFKKVIVKGAKTNNATIQKLVLGNTYYFKVKAYVKSGKKTLVGKTFSNTLDVKTWKMVWNDEFSGTALDTSKWAYSTGNTGYGSSMLVDYQKECSEVKDGNLLIKPEFQWNTSSNKAVSESYRSAMITTQNHYEVKYGKIEIRAKVPKGQGTWSAAWMLGTENTWPHSGEIDILEATQNLGKPHIEQCIHCTKFNVLSSGTGSKHQATEVADASTAYHTYGIVWTKNAITFTIDGKDTWTYDPSEYMQAASNATDQSDIWPFNNPFYLILNCGLGDALGGEIHPESWTKISSDGDIDTYQDCFSIDWVRVYQ